MSHVTLDHPWLELDLGTEMQVLSWSLNRPGFVQARRILWREVRNADLPIDLDVDSWLATELKHHKAEDAVTLLTSRDIRHFTERAAAIGKVEAHAVATVGFSNAERVGHRVDRSAQDWGTINVGLCLNTGPSTGLTQAALLEATSIVVQARTAAVMEAHLPIASGIATGTGTDCVAVASPAGKERYAGLHTDIGEAIGRAVYTAVYDGARHWITSMRELDNAAS